MYADCLVAPIRFAHSDNCNVTLVISSTSLNVNLPKAVAKAAGFATLVTFSALGQVVLVVVQVSESSSRAALLELVLEWRALQLIECL